jgi:RimJ/RimL family protein N-acetyltransferase
MIELHPEEFSNLSPLFNQTRFGVLTAGTLEGGHPGRVFVDRPGMPAVALVCTRVGYYFLAGQPGADITEEISRLVSTDLAAWQQQNTGDSQMMFFFHHQDWKEFLIKTFQDTNPVLIHKKRLTLRRGTSSATSNWRKRFPERMRMLRVTPELLEQYPEKADEMKLFWGSAELFTDKGLGYWLMDGDTIASSCESVFIGAGEVEISIATSMPYRRRGLARLTAGAFIENCLERNLNPVWGCWPENVASLALARDLGFEDDVDQNACLLEYARA